MNYSNSRVRGYGLLGYLYLSIDNLNRILIKLAKISVSAMVCSSWGSRGSNHSGVIGWRCSGLVYASYLKSGTRSSGIAKSKLALLQVNPTHLYLDTCA